jgi:N12 class adenine-specific DNA methylase
MTRFTNFPVKRSDSPEFALHSKRHALRLEQHEEQKRNYFRNIQDERHAAEHAEMMGVARGLSSNEISMATKRDGSVSIGRRAPDDAHSQPMADCRCSL